MNKYEIRVTNTEDDNDFETRSIDSSGLSSVMDIIDSAQRLPDVEFQYGEWYIVIYEASDEGYMYDIYDSKKDYEEGCGSKDGGQCTSTLSNAIEMALSHA